MGVSNTRKYHTTLRMYVRSENASGGMMVQTSERTSLDLPDRFTLQLRNTLCLDTCVSLMFRTWSSSDIALDQIACLVQTWDER